MLVSWKRRKLEAQESVIDPQAREDVACLGKDEYVSLVFC